MPTIPPYLCNIKSTTVRPCFLSKYFCEEIRFDLRSRRLFDFDVSSSEIEEEVFARNLVSRIRRLFICEIELELHGLVFRIIGTRYRIRTGEGICREIRSVYENRYRIGGRTGGSGVIPGQ